uniref:Protein aurora borealis n=1 Tax=Tetraodon nigroviridis TaxID=99883 RepID=H3BYS4_TETNG
MGDHAEFASQITPETPGRPSIRNPFESPNDYHHLREALVPSPSAFKSKPCKSTPPKFDWSIDEMASLLPVHIDPEEIQRQSFYLSQTRMDSDIEEKRQNAIEQFFTKGTIVPSPWATASSREHCQLKIKSCGSDMIVEEPEKSSVACQTTLSLPFTFNLEKVLGHYYRHEEEAGDPVQESLSSSSLRRKLFLDGQSSFSGSDSSGPPSPERGFSRRGQFSSSPIQNGRFRDCSLGSIASPLLPHRSSPAGLPTPSVSPIVVPGPNSPSSGRF